jgi:hypothetical protein
MKEHEHLTYKYLRDTARPMLEAIFADTGSARDDLLDSLTQYAHWRIDAIHDKLCESEKYEELQKRADALESCLKSQISERQWKIAQEWNDMKYAQGNMRDEMLFLFGCKEGIAFCRALGEFK